MSRATSALLSLVLVLAFTQPAMAQDEASAAPSTDPVDLAVLAIPEAHRASATVLSHDGSTTLREGDGMFVCLADNPGEEAFSAVCYHRSLEPYMARGRALRAEGITGRSGIERRWEEIEAGTLEMPRHPASLFRVSAAADSAVTTATERFGRLTVIYMAYATVDETGLPGQPDGRKPWLMYPGTPTAHVMISGR